MELLPRFLSDSLIWGIQSVTQISMYGQIQWQIIFPSTLQMQEPPYPPFYLAVLLRSFADNEKWPCACASHISDHWFVLILLFYLFICS